MNKQPIPASYDFSSLSEETLEQFRITMKIQSESTFQNYCATVNQFLKWLQQNQIRQPQMEDILHWKEDLKVQGLKPSTINNQLTGLRKFFKYTALCEKYPDIMAGIRNEKEENGFQREYFSEDQIRTVIQHCLDQNDLKGLRDACILLLMASTGLRTLSVVQADIRDLSRSEDQPVLFCSGKGKAGKKEGVPLSLELEKLIRKYLEQRHTSSPEEPLFAGLGNNNQGRRMTDRGLRKLIRTRFLEAGLEFSESMTTHSLRVPHS